MGVLTSTSPATGAHVRSWRTHTPEQIEQALQDAHDAFTSWRTSAWPQRGALLEAVADQMTSRREHLAALMTDEMGKPVTEALAEVDKCAWKIGRAHV